MAGFIQIEGQPARAGPPVDIALRHPASIIAAAAARTTFEWYDFFVYGAVAGILAKNVFANIDPNLAYLFSLLAFSAGFAGLWYPVLVTGLFGCVVAIAYRATRCRAAP